MLDAFEHQRDTGYNNTRFNNTHEKSGMYKFIEILYMPKVKILLLCVFS